jgi:hypothetical protein
MSSLSFAARGGTLATAVTITLRRFFCSSFGLILLQNNFPRFCSRCNFATFYFLYVSEGAFLSGEEITQEIRLILLFLEYSLISSIPHVTSPLTHQSNLETFTRILTQQPIRVDEESDL